MEDDWDLHAVVRGCATTTTTTATTAGGKIFSTYEQDPTFSSCSSSFQDLFEPRTERFVEDQLHNICKPFFPKQKLEPNSQTVLFSPQRLPVITPSQDPSSSQLKQQFIKQIPQQTRIQHKPQLFSVANGPKSSVSHHSTPKSKKRKNHLKRVCHVAAEGLSSDMWSWRKYGQKPIKGSPYPRGYYKCSTLAGCMARKQVERNRSDPGMFIVTYTAEHNHPMPAHRNTLAGSSRLKPAETPNSDEPKKASSSPEMSPADSLSPLLEKLDDDDDDVSASDMALDDSFFAGLDDFTGQDGGECLADQFPASLQFPWLESAATTTVAATAAGGG